MKYYVAYKMKGQGFDCTGCQEKKCLFKGPVTILTYDLNDKGKRIRKRIKDVDKMFDYIDKQTNRFQDATELDLIWTYSGNRVCPIPLIDIETVHLYQAIQFGGKVDPRHILKLPAYYVQLKAIVDAETGRMERQYAT